MSISSGKKKKKLLLITTASGGGHMQAAKALAVKVLLENPETEVIQKDVLVDLTSKRLGKGFVCLWNSAQKRGNIKLLVFLQKNVPTADLVFGGLIFLRTLYILLKQGIDQIVDTQPVGTAPIIKAIKIVRKITGKPLKLEKIVTELPTDSVIHFFKPIKRLSESDRSLIRLITTIPLLKKDQTREGFWKKNCGLSENEVCYESFPLRPSFQKYLHQVREKNNQMPILIHVASSEEKFLIVNSMKRGFMPSEIYRNKIAITIEPDYKVSTILLGSQPTEEATLKYLKRYTELMSHSATEKYHLLFVFCNRHLEHRNSLLKRVHDLIHKIEDFSDHLSVIPMCFQNDDVIASLYYRSDATFTRSGGLTAMELMSVAQGQIWIHSEVRQKAIDGEELGRGMPIWERGNATYLQKKKGARFITPETFIDCCHPYFS